MWNSTYAAPWSDHHYEQRDNKACVSMYGDDSIMYASATTANEVTETLNIKVLHSVLDWMASNKLVLNI